MFRDRPGVVMYPPDPLSLGVAPLLIVDTRIRYDGTVSWRAGTIAIEQTFERAMMEA
jgi:hypothetical protein